MNKSIFPNPESRILNPNRGFTLIEVLIAVAILAIGLLAVIRVTGLAIRNSEYLQQKTLAHWVATDVIAQVEVGLTPTPTAGATQNGQAQILNQKFAWQLTATSVPDLPIIQVQVNILDPKTQRSIDSLQTYVNKPNIMYALGSIN